MKKVLSCGSIELLDLMGCSLDIVNAAKMSFLKYSTEYGEKEKKLLKYLILNSHTSPLEMTEWKFQVSCPIFVARHWMRHRTWSFNEMSRRYTSEKIEIFERNEKRKEFYKASVELYDKLIESGEPLEEARDVLPVATMTHFLAKVDGNNLIKFVILRNGSKAQKEIQEYANAIIELTSPYIGDVWNILKENNIIR